MGSGETAQLDKASTYYLLSGRPGGSLEHLWVNVYPGNASGGM